MRTLRFGWLLLAALVVCGAPLGAEMAGGYGGGPVRLRTFLVVYNAVVAGAHAALLGVVWWGSGALARGGGRAAARALWAAAAVMALALAGWPLWAGTGPWAADDWTVRVLRVLVFAPSVLRAVGWALLVVALPRAARSGAGGGRGAGAALLALSAADLAINLAVWAATPLAVVARLHGAGGWGLVPFVAASALFVARLRAA